MMKKIKVTFELNKQQLEVLTMKIAQELTRSVGKLENMKDLADQLENFYKNNDDLQY